MIELITITKASGNWYLSKAIVNPEHIVMVVESKEHNRLLSEGKIDIGLNSHIQFSKIQMAISSGFNEFIVVGSPTSIIEKLNKNKKQLLKG